MVFNHKTKTGEHTMKNATIKYYPNYNDRTVSYSIPAEVGRTWVYVDMTQFGYGNIAFRLGSFQCHFEIQFMGGCVFLCDFNKF